jgi:hypothetical protein
VIELSDLTPDEKTVLVALNWDDQFAYLSNDEMATPGVSPNTRASRLSSLQSYGLVHGRYRAGKRFKEWARRRIPVAPRMKVPTPRFRVAAVEPVLIGSMERVIIEAPAGTFQPGMEVRL